MPSRRHVPPWTSSSGICLRPSSIPIGTMTTRHRRRDTYGNPTCTLSCARTRRTTSYGQEVFFQAPDGFSLSPAYQSASGLLNACGYRVVYGMTILFARLVLRTQVAPIVSCKAFSLPRVSRSLMTRRSPIRMDPVALATELPVAENIIAMIVWPRLSAGDDPNGTSLTSNYLYNSAKTPQASRSLPTATNSRPRTDHSHRH